MSRREDLVREILVGQYHTVPPLSKREVRIFLSSTFTDTNAERDYLIEKIYPRLRQHCKHNYDLDFQMVDMRWGIPLDAFIKYDTTELCLREIKNCKRFSMGPNFVTIIGQKYGLRPLPRSIQLDEFNVLRNELQNEDMSFKINIDERSTIKCFDNLLDVFFRLDTNATPHIYRLSSIGQVFENFNSLDANQQKYLKTQWDSTQSRLVFLLRKAADAAFSKNLIEASNHHRYFVSITEKEIFSGILKDEERDSSTLCFIRHINGLENNLSDSNIGRFLDVTSGPEGKIIDEESQRLLHELKNEKIRNKLSAENIFELEVYNINWANNGLSESELTNYLQMFGELFYQQVLRLIEKAIAVEKKRETDIRLVYEQIQGGTVGDASRIDEFRELVSEISEHAIQYQNITRKFFGRDHLLTKIQEYVLSDSRSPFVVAGESGCGKTSVMAIAHQAVPLWVGNPANCILLTRFLGTTAFTSSIYKALMSIALQAHYVYSLLVLSSKSATTEQPTGQTAGEGVPNNITILLGRLETNESIEKSYLAYSKCLEIEALREYIERTLRKMAELRPSVRILVVLDSVDQLSHFDYKTVDKWLLTRLPLGCKMLVSTIPKHGNLLDMITQLIAKEYRNDFAIGSTAADQLLGKTVAATTTADTIEAFLERHTLLVQPLSASESEQILANWLRDAHKSLTDAQRESLRAMFSAGTLLPLYLKLVYDVCAQWCSYDAPESKFTACLQIDDLIIYMLHRLEQKHGEVLLRRALCYMAVCKNGISNMELEDLLSLDEDVLYAVFQVHMPPLRRLPTILWVRIKSDLGEYLVEKEDDDVKIVCWYHRRFIEVVTQRYVTSLSRADYERLFQNIFELFDETWLNRAKPYQINDYLRAKLKIAPETAVMAERFVSAQPVKFVGIDGAVKYNRRKLSLLPRCLAHMNGLDALEKSCQLVYYNYTFMQAKLACEYVQEVLHDLKQLLSAFQSFQIESDAYKELALFQRLLQLCGSVIEENPGCFAHQVSSRLLIYYGKNKYATLLIDACDTLGIDQSALVAPYFQQAPPGGFLLATLVKHSEPITQLLYLMSYFVTVSRTKLHVYKFDRSQSTQRGLFEIKLPSEGHLREFLSSRKERSSSSNAADMPLNTQGTKLTPHGKATDDYYNRRCPSHFKCVYNHETLQSLVDSEQTDLSENNADFFPVLFLAISQHFVYILRPNGQIKFVYECEKQTGREILDAFILRRHQLLVVEKNSATLKLCVDYDQVTPAWREYPVKHFSLPEPNLTESEASESDPQIVRALTASNAYVTSQALDWFELTLQLSNGVVQQLIVRSNMPQKETSSQLLNSDTMSLLDNKNDNAICDLQAIVFKSALNVSAKDVPKATNSEENISLHNQHNHKKQHNHHHHHHHHHHKKHHEEDSRTVNATDIKESIIIETVLSFRPSAVKENSESDSFNLLKVTNGLKFSYKKFMNEPCAGRLYVSYADGSLLLLNNNNSTNHKSPTCCLFRKLTKQPVVEIKLAQHLPASQLFYGTLKTSDFIYIVHSVTLTKSHLNAVCALELKEKVDEVQMLGNRFYFIARQGIIELFKFKCQGNKHTTKLILSINTLSQNVTKMICYHDFVFCATNEGVFNIYQILKQDEAQMFPSFNRTFNSMRKFYPFYNHAVSVSSFNELTHWDLRNGSIVEKIAVDSSLLGKKVQKVKISLASNVILLLMKSGTIGIFKDFKFVHKAESKADPDAKHRFVFLNGGEILRFQSDKLSTLPNLLILDLITLGLFELQLEATFTANQSAEKDGATSLSGLRSKFVHRKILNSPMPTGGAVKTANALGTQWGFRLLVKKLNCVLVFDKHIKSFVVRSYVDKSAACEKRSLRFQQIRDQKQFDLFMQLNGLANFKYKVLYLDEKSDEVIFAVSALKSNKYFVETDVHSSVVVQARIVSGILRAGDKRSLDVEINGVWPFCKTFKFKLGSNGETPLLAINRVIEVNQALAVDKSVAEKYTILNRRICLPAETNVISIFRCQTGQLMFKLDLTQNNIEVHNMCISNDMRYLAFFDVKKVVRLYRLDDIKMIACLSLYGRVRQMRFNHDNRFLCLSMNDRRIFSLMVVDQNCSSHLMRIKELPSRTALSDQFKQEDSKNNDEDEAEELKDLFNKNKVPDKNDSDNDSADEDPIQMGTQNNYESIDLSNIEQNLLEKISHTTKKVKNTEDDESSDDEEIEKKNSEKVQEFSKNVTYPITINTHIKDILQPNWLIEYVKFAKNKIDNIDVSHELNVYNRLKKLVNQNDRSLNKDKQKSTEEMVKDNTIENESKTIDHVNISKACLIS